jgi:hypothetical protein
MSFVNMDAKPRKNLKYGPELLRRCCKEFGAENDLVDPLNRSIWKSKQPAEYGQSIGIRNNVSFEVMLRSGGATGIR